MVGYQRIDRTPLSKQEREYVVKELKKLNIHAYKAPNRVLYKYVNLEVGKEILNGGKLLYQTINNFNDPFEAHIGLLDFTEAVDRAHLKLPDISRDIHLNFLETIFNEMRTRFGILCLSKTNLSTLMWSHYSDKHRGLCIGFKDLMLLPRLDPDVANIFTVNYINKFVPRKQTTLPTIDNAISYVYWLCTKAKHWEYEQEVRIIDEMQSGLIPFNKSNLCEIYFGVATPQSEIEIIKELADKNGYALSKSGRMKIGKMKFDLEIECLSKNTH